MKTTDLLTAKVQIATYHIVVLFFENLDLLDMLITVFKQCRITIHRFYLQKNYQMVCSI